MLNKHVVFTWELGGGLGHITSFSLLAKALLDKGYQVSVISKNVSLVADVLGHLPIKVYQSPLILQSTDNLKVTYSYAEIIFDWGYKSTATLCPLVDTWKNLFELLKPDLVIADHSPTALVACKILKLKNIIMGTGFSTPPQVAPLPSLESMKVPDQKAFLQHENQVLSSINGVLTKYNTLSFEHLHQLFNVDDNFLCTFAELDHYSTRNGADYCGPCFDIDVGSSFVWGKSKSTKVFAYIKQNTPGFELLLAALIQSNNNLVLYIPQANAKVIEICKKSKNAVLLNKPANMRQVLNEADMIVSHAGHGVVSAALLHGKRLLLVPSQLEQSILVYLLAKRRLVTAVNPRNEKINYAAAIQFTCTNAELGKNIEMFKQKYAGFNSSDQLENMVKSCENIIS
ncbi:glycosyltransferase [Pseudocolwellia sp. HL-MZ19]|uniref:glycosyltransferase n=1 Tax=Pseudocolwellia sp. HL-MZ19 TaxID=3400846 RepID=UPI003CF6D494